jgi:hypothetical protein
VPRSIHGAGKSDEAERTRLRADKTRTIPEQRNLPAEVPDARARIDRSAEQTVLTIKDKAEVCAGEQSFAEMRPATVRRTGHEVSAAQKQTQGWNHSADS